MNKKVYCNLFSRQTHKWQWFIWIYEHRKTVQISLNYAKRFNSFDIVKRNRNFHSDILNTFISHDFKLDFCKNDFKVDNIFSFPLEQMVFSAFHCFFSFHIFPQYNRLYDKLVWDFSLFLNNFQFYSKIISE